MTAQTARTEKLNLRLSRKAKQILRSAAIHPKIAQERLGHSSIKTTLDLYSHVTDTMQGEAASTLDSAFRSAIKTTAKHDPQPS